MARPVARLLRGIRRGALRAFSSEAKSEPSGSRRAVLGLLVAGSGALAADAAPEARAARGGRRPLMVSEKHRVVTQETRPVCLFSVCGCLGVTTRSAANGRTAAGNIDDIRRRRRTSVTALTNYYHYGSNECPGITSRPFPQTSRRRPGASAAARGAEPC
ncbi:unnamed protein product [Durusdinium trenchii]|uniref:Beta-galactosidase n=1 Tax=Durusdinium trenchii TaxID=1381693 RepID=A0ABP0SYY1_9DINO